MQGIFLEDEGIKPFITEEEYYVRHEKRDRTPPDLRHYLPSGRGQDHPYREAPALRRSHPDGRFRKG